MLIGQSDGTILVWVWTRIVLLLWWCPIRTVASSYS